MTYTSPFPPRLLSLPEEFALLSLTNSGKVRDSAVAVVGCAAAELGELALRGKLLVQSRKFRLAGLDVYRPHDAEVHLLDTSRTGLVWADELLAELERHAASDHGRFVLKRWLRQRRESFSLHRNALLERGLLRYKPSKHPRLFRFLERYYPDPVARNALISQLQATNGQSRLDGHMLLLSDLVDSCGLDKDLGVTLSWRQRLDRGRGVGMVASLPEALLDTSAILAGSVPKRSRHQD